MITRAMILAAGLGTRMRPLTDNTPKPLVKLNGRPLIDYKLDTIRQSGIKTVVVNVHYLADQIEAHLSSVRDLEIIISDERDMLMDSGGGIHHALPHLGTAPFIVMNADTFWTNDDPKSINQLINLWNGNQMDILLALADRKKAVGFTGEGDFYIESANHLSWRGERANAPYAFTGEYILKPEIFRDLPDQPFSALTLFDRAMTANRLYGYELAGHWYDVGTPKSLEQAQTAIAQQ